MFTGLIQALGRILPLSDEQFQISCVSGQTDLILEDLAIGDSVAVNGVCLTVVEIITGGFVATASPETLRRTTLGEGLDGYFNLETSLRAGSKLGGHFVTGHVDGIGCLQSSVQTASSWEMQFSAPTEATLWHQHIAPFIVPKGSIAINGISLTIADCDREGNWFQVAVIPHTYSQTNLKYLKPGSWVNLEADILGKYVAKFLRTPAVFNEMPSISTIEDITPEFLAEHGFS
ncbi:riboflavin synthase [Limnoraphis robusta Tam1]|uniref:riboflavin synthase n=1 Tax=Limnoraphis robusta TaxID=1118279 RepID=UPI002B20121B|nr:riboflavin synthase [Limnoraphis robusta]MEA5539977.1 riboflavin synthase [Limnoraphis robusta Tam1]